MKEHAKQSAVYTMKEQDYVCYKLCRYKTTVVVILKDQMLFYI